MKRSAVSAQEWIRHRKLRKKIASAKWYAHKKQREIEEEHTHRQRIEEDLREQERLRRGYTWPSVRQRCEWIAVVNHLAKGYPERPSTTDAILWRSWCDEIESGIDHLREKVTQWFPGCAVWMNETFVCKIFRQMGIREKMHPDAFRSIQVPLGHRHPHDFKAMWSTSPWNWMWVMTHLGGQSDRFTDVWCHLHQHALGYTLTGHDAWYLITHSPTLAHWFRWMSQNLHESLETTDAVVNNDSTQSDDDDSPIHEPHEGYITQPDTPEWEDVYTSDSESDSIPSSLDTLVNEIFANSNPEE